MTEPVRIRLTKNARSRESLVILGTFQGDSPPRPDASAALVQALDRAAGRSGFDGRPGQRAEAETRSGASRVVVLHGLGPAEKFDRDALQRWTRRLAVEIRSHGRSSALVVLPPHQLLSGTSHAEAFLRRLAICDYRFLEFKKPPPGRTPIRSITVVPPPDELRDYRRALPIAEAIAAGIATTRDLANTPPNVATPAWMASRARALARQQGMKVSVLGPTDLKRRKMGGILAVGGGSANSPRLVRLEWGSGKKTISLVGKGVTFDTGGISIKPAAAMDEMKYDKSGACTVLGIAHAVSLLDLPIRLRVYVPLAENMPDGAAYRPGDIVTCHGGKTVEILNTDAEGRMILADALSWAAQSKPDYLLDYATLTGACVVALGNSGAGLFTPDDELASGLLDGAAEAEEYLWRLPLWGEFGRSMKGVHADLRNSGPRWGGASTAAAFLSEFVSGARNWAHLDIAGPAYVGGAQRNDKGATGYGVALTVRWMQSLLGQ